MRRSRLIEMQRRLLASQVAEQKAKLASTDRQIAQKEAERATLKATIDKLEATLPPLQQRVDIRSTCSSKELGSKLIYLQNCRTCSASSRRFWCRRAS